MTEMHLQFSDTIHFYVKIHSTSKVTSRFPICLTKRQNVLVFCTCYGVATRVHCIYLANQSQGSSKISVTNIFFSEGDVSISLTLCSSLACALYLTI